MALGGINEYIKPSEPITNKEFIRRTSLSIGGRIATPDEIKEFERNGDRKELVKKIIQSDDYVGNIYNKWADLLRIKPQIEGIDCRFYPYIDYVKKSVKEDKPVDKFTMELLSARGKLLENPATGFLIRDNGMSLCNLSYTTQIFLGTDISCAQCHDDPFQDWTQIEFYQMASFFGGVKTRNNDLSENHPKFKEFIEKVKSEQGKIDLENPFRQMLRANAFAVSDSGVGIRLPKDYKYDDAAPHQHMDPKVIYGEDIMHNRESFALWLVDQNHFSLAMSNRIWEWVIGEPLIPNENNVHIQDSKNPALSSYLSKRFREVNFSAKRLIYEIAASNAFSNKAIPSDKYDGSAPPIERLSAEKVWDSLLTLYLGKPDIETYPSDRYVKVMLLNEPPKLEEVAGVIEEYRKFDPIPNAAKENGWILTKSSMLLDRRGKTEDFLKLFGASERELVDTDSTEGSSSQEIQLINGEIQSLLLSKNSQLSKLDGQDIDQLFLATLNRLATLDEKSRLGHLHFDELVWVLTNSREFQFQL